MCERTLTPRVLQVMGRFDIVEELEDSITWDVTLPLDDQEWHVGLITGPSGSGKSTLAKEFWPRETSAIYGGYAWPTSSSVIDNFPAGLGIDEICNLLCAVGFSSPPAWLRPYHILSTGERFRVNMARTLAENPTLAVVDEYSSVVDRTVAQVGSHAIGRTVRQRGQKFIAVTCHDDVEEWLNPDWVYRVDQCKFTWRLLQQRPTIKLTISKVGSAAWELFKRHHYLTDKIKRSASCYLATVDGRPVAFSAWIVALCSQRTYREHRTVVLPDWQGIGIAKNLANLLASAYASLGKVSSVTTHPHYIRSRLQDPNWKITRYAQYSQRDFGLSRIAHATNRLTSSFTYIGPKMQRLLAKALIGK